MENLLDRVLCGDCVEVLKQLPDASVHTIVTDPPYGLEFMGEEWDTFKGGNTVNDKPLGAKRYQKWTTSWATEALRALKPGASMLVMGGTRTHHRMMCGVEDAGFEIKDTLVWAYNSGFPKAQDLGKMIDKRMGVEREVVGKGVYANRGAGINGRTFKYSKSLASERDVITAPATDLAKKWDGWKVGGLKPAWEPIVWAIKPPEGAFIDNVLKHGVGAINVDACRIPYESEDDLQVTQNKASKDLERFVNRPSNYDKYGGGKGLQQWYLGEWGNPQGRYPANMVRTDRLEDGYDRFYFVPKAGRGERDEGLAELPIQRARVTEFQAESVPYRMENGKATNPKAITFAKNIHPTVKPVTLMQHLIKLVTREGQVVLDPFVGSGTTCVAARLLNRHYIGIDTSAEYCGIAKQRLANIPIPIERYAISG